MLPSRQTIRLRDHDYSGGAYFVTVCTAERRPLFGEVVTGEMHPTELGRIVERCWFDLSSRFPHVTCDAAFCVMPNHVHGILYLSGRPGTRPLGPVIGAFKGAVSACAREQFGLETVWQRNYYEHGIRSEAALDPIRLYIVGNASTWEMDRENPCARGVDPFGALMSELTQDARTRGPRRPG